MKLFVKKLIKKAVFDRPSILYTKMTASSSNNSSSLAFHHHHESNHTDNNSLLRNRIPIRFLILGLIVLATAIDYVTRVNINIAIVTMVKQNSSHHDVHGEVCPFSSNEVPHIQEVTTVAVKNQSSSHRMIRPEEEASRFTWSPTTQGVILGSFWWSYMAMQIPSGRMAEEFGGKTIVSISLIGSGIINLLTPLAASRSVRLMVLTRMFLGFVQGGIFPSCYSMITKWFPLSERSLGFAFMEIGATIGSVIATTMGGYLSEHGFSGGWPSVFYVSGLLALIAFTAWYSFTESSPSTYPGMPSDELIYIQGDSLTGMGMSMKGSSSMTTSLPSASSNTSSFDDNGRTSSQTISMAGTALPGKSYDTSPPFTPREQHLDQHAFEIREEATARIERISASNNILTTSGSSMTSGVKSRPFVPWREILTSPPVLAVIVSKFCGGWTYFTLLSKLPAYLHDVLHVPPTQVSFPAIVPFVVL
jgi:MFS family permease